MQPPKVQRALRARGHGSPVAGAAIRGMPAGGVAELRCGHAVEQFAGFDQLSHSEVCMKSSQRQTCTMRLMCFTPQVGRSVRMTGSQDSPGVQLSNAARQVYFTGGVTQVEIFTSSLETSTDFTSPHIAGCESSSFVGLLCTKKHFLQTGSVATHRLYGHDICLCERLLSYCAFQGFVSAKAL